MKSKLLTLFFINFIGIYSIENFAAENLLTKEEISSCQKQANEYGNGKGDDYISEQCQNSFKGMANSLAIKKTKGLKITFYGHRNMLLLEKNIDTAITTLITAGSSTKLKAIKTLAVDEKNQEVIVLEESGDVLFFTYKLAGNIAPYRILKHKDLVGASELVVDNIKDQIIVYNNKTNKILFFSRLANVNGRKEKQFLNIIKTIQTLPTMELRNLVLDSEESILSAFDSAKNKYVYFPLK